MRCLVVCCCLTAPSAVSAAEEMRNVHKLPAAGASLLGSLGVHELVYEDTLAKVARLHGIGIGALMRLNPDVDLWLPEPGGRLLLPTAYILPDAPREGIVVNLSERRLYYFDTDAAELSVFPIGIGKEGFATPVMVTRTVTRIENPSWTPPQSVRVEHAARGHVLAATVPPGPDNPLGKYAIKLAAPGYLLHGTNQPIGVGQRVSHGCIRLYAPHIEALVRGVPNGTQVRIIRQPHKVAWHDGALYLESHDDEQSPGNHDLTAVVKQIIALTQDATTTNASNVVIDWQLATETALHGRGIPVQISKMAD